MRAFETDWLEPTGRPSVLYLTHRVPYPPDKGDRIRNYHLLRYLAARADVHLACLADEPASEEVVAELRRLCARVAVVPLSRWKRRARMAAALFGGATVSEGAFASPELRSVLHHWGSSLHFDVALASSSSLAPYLQEPALGGVPAVVDLVDVDSQKWLDYAAAGHGPLAWLHRLEGRRLRALESSISTWARAVTLVSEPEVELFRSYCTTGRVRAVVNGVDLDYFRPMDQRTQPACVFVGALDYTPNVDAASWFCTEIWPRVRRRVPRAEFWLVGRQPTPAVRRLAQLPGVQLVGPVPDVRPYLARAAVAVVPLRLARGVQNKVLEALAMAKAVIASPRALAALRVQPGAHLLAASSPAEWEEAVLSLLADEDKCQELGAAGRAYVEKHHHWDHCLAPFADLLGLRDNYKTALEEPSPAIVESKSA
jgi:sugar transferase (PEP-CTERM/EpsH1 system associated)